MAPKSGPKDILYLCDETGEVYAVQLSMDVWEKVEAHVTKAAESAGAPEAAEDPPLKPEPLADWNTLTEYWDFKYPVNHSVRCDCGQETEHWLEDDPRKFWLTACNLGGLLTYRCMACKAKVTKRLFKDKVTFQTTPFVPEQNQRKNARYD